VGHDHTASLTGRRLALSIIVTVAFVIGEGITGFVSHSLALMSDAGHLSLLMNSFYDAFHRRTRRIKMKCVPVKVKRAFTPSSLAVEKAGIFLGRVFTPLKSCPP
jgi:hypothetical protein